MNIKLVSSTKDLAKMTLLTALLCISSYIIIPLPFSLVSITAQTIIINLIAFLLKPKQTFITISLFLLIGLIGIPVFSGGAGGPEKLFGPTGGYLFGYLIAATVISLLRGDKFNLKKCIFLSILVGMPIIYILGAAYMEVLTSMSLKALIATSILPFIPLDILKCIIASFLAKILNRFVIKEDFNFMSVKSNLLKELEKNKGHIISGGNLSKALNVSRTSVWKQIEELRKEGYEIISYPNKGYSLSYENDLISKEGILPYLSKKYSNISINTYKTLESTNKTAKELSFSGSPSGTVVISEEQTMGRGRLGRNFYSPCNSGIYMSIILKPNLTVSDSVLITTAASVAVCKAIEKVTKIKAQIKWINDIFINNKKVCGILTEASTDFESGSINHIILGIGINVNTPKESFPKELQSTAGSLFDSKNNIISRNQLCAEIINEVLLIIDNIKTHNFIDEYKERSIVLNKDIIFIRNGISNRGRAIDIKDDGSLVVKKLNDEIITLNSGEISIRGI